MNLEDLRKKYPKGWEEFVEYLNNNFKDVKIDELKDLLIYEIEVNEYMYNVFGLLMTFFDNKGLYTGIYCSDDGIDWHVEICGIHIDAYSSREDAELNALSECFNTLEKLI